MAYQELRFRITGVSPLLHHNGQLADPLNELARALKAVTGKRVKTDSDYEEMARLEWYGSLYLKDGKPCIPGMVIEAMLVEASRRNKRGKQAQAGIFVSDDALLEYDGSTDLEELWKNKDYRLTVGVKVKQSRVMRTRPKFDKWAAFVSIMFDDGLMNASEIAQAIRVAGEVVGLNDWRPKFGRFKVEQVS